MVLKSVVLTESLVFAKIGAPITLNESMAIKANAKTLVITIFLLGIISFPPYLNISQSGYVDYGSFIELI
jgi:hypothetical protein